MMTYCLQIIMLLLTLKIHKKTLPVNLSFANLLLLSIQGKVKVDGLPMVGTVGKPAVIPDGCAAGGG